MLSELGRILREGSRFVLTTHKNPDADGIGSMLALGRALQLEGKRTLLLTDSPLEPPLTRMKGAAQVTQHYEPAEDSETLIMLDCADRERPGGVMDALGGNDLVTINIDHHATNTFFGEFNWVEPDSSSTGELVHRLLQYTELPLDPVIAENLFIAIQSDTGSFRFENTGAEAFRIASCLVSDYGVRPWKCARMMMYEYGEARLRLLGLVIPTLERHLGGAVAMMTVSLEMLKEAGAHAADSEKFVDYPRFISGVEMGVLIRQTAPGDYKFSLRSNEHLDVAALARRFGGGGHNKAAGFDARGELQELKRTFLLETADLMGTHAS